jgi:hypothetical protein
LQEVFVSLQKAAAKKIQAFASRKNANQICRTPFRHEKSRRKKNSNICKITKTQINLQEVFVSLQKAAAKKFQTFAARKNANQICRTPFRHEKSRRKKISNLFVPKKHGSNLQDAISSRKKLPQKKFRPLRDEKTWIKTVCVMIRMMMG